jgi:endonuclease III
MVQAEVGVIVRSVGQSFFPSVIEVARRLDAVYPDTNLGNKSNPLDELAYILLSGQTDSTLSQRAFASFKTRYPRWGVVAQAPARAIASSIRVGGLAKQKAGYLREIAHRVRTDFGKVSLSPLRAMSTQEAEQYLCSLPGVGIKTARCVLLYSLKRDVFPADVHCLRTMSRLGWLHWTRERGETLADIAQNGIPRLRRRILHIRFVQHGRAVCRSRPVCSVCVLNDLCPTAAKGPS